MKEATFDSVQSRSHEPVPRPSEAYVPADGQGSEANTYESESVREMQRLVFQDVIIRLIHDMGGNETAAAHAMGVEVETLKVWLAE